MDYRKFFQSKKIDCQKGLSPNEFNIIENTYNILFPSEYRLLLEQVVPVSPGFYNWRDYSDSNIKFIKAVIERPIKEFWDRSLDVDWNSDWGEEPKERSDLSGFVRYRLALAPRLIPVYSHRYTVMCGGKNDPILSICGTDVIYYGTNIDEYLEIEFGDKNQCTIDFLRIRTIPFWSEVI